LEAGAGKTIAEALNAESPPEHGAQRLEDGFNIMELVAEYNILRGCVHDLAESHGVQLQGHGFLILNRILDGAIGAAVETFAEQQALEVKRRRHEYLSFVAHDLRNPLTAISLAAGVLESNQQEQQWDQESVQMIKTLHRNVARLETLVTNVLKENTELESMEGVKPERRDFDLWPLVESLVLALRPMADQEGTRLVNLVPDDLVVNADAGLLRRILQNLLSNAIAYTVKGEVLIGARPQKDGLMECWVTDTGTGIPTERLDKVFEKGEGDPSRDDSTGLGLAIVKAFVEAHEGTVQAEHNAAGQGTTIRFTLGGK